MEAEVKAKMEEAKTLYKSTIDLLNVIEQSIVGIVQNMMLGGRVTPQMILIFLAGLKTWITTSQEQVRNLYILQANELERSSGRITELEEKVSELQDQIPSAHGDVP